MSEQRFEITPDLAGLRLDQALSRLMPERSRAALQKAVQAGHCAVDGLTQTSPRAKVRLGQTVTLRPLETGGALKPEEGHLELLWQDSHLVVCNKPAGLTVHPCPSCPEQTLVQRLLGRFPQLRELEGMRPGIVHRLDKDTSGLLVAALTEPDRLRLSAAFARREVHKEYLALVSGLPPARGQCREPLGRHPTARVKMAVVPESGGGRPAHSQWRVLWHSPDERVALLAVRIHTGRTHQIRVHMAHEGHPLLGDRLYAPKETQAMAPRQMLHAWRLSFTHPADGKNMSFACPPPDDMLQAALAAARRMTRVVVTGNPGSGKSALTEELARLGVPVISADAVVAAWYAPGGEAAQWMGRFGQRGGAPLVTDKGAVDRAALLEAMRSDPALKREVERVVHAMAHDAVDAFWRRCEAEGAPLAVAEVPLFFECGWRNSFTPEPLAVGVRCPQPERLRRIMAARGWSEDKASALEAWQWPEDRKMAACNLVVDNAGDAENLSRAARNLLRALEEKRTSHETTLARRLSALCS